MRGIVEPSTLDALDDQARLLQVAALGAGPVAESARLRVDLMVAIGNLDGDQLEALKRYVASRRAPIEANNRED